MGNPAKKNPQELCQGNRAAPAIWSIVRKILLNCLREKYHGAAFKCRISHYSFHLVGYCFVDDYITIQVAPTPDTPLEETVKLEQKGLTIFAGAKKSTGGQVSAKKIEWYIIDFKLKSEGK